MLSFTHCSQFSKIYLENKAPALRKFILIIFFILPFSRPWKLFSQAVRDPLSASYPGLGAYSNDHQDVFSFHANQAALAKINYLSAGIYGEKRFLLRELSLYNISVALPTHSGNFGLDARYYGFSDYNEAQLGLAYGRNLGSKADVGIQFNYYGVKIPGYGTSSAVNFEIGTILHLTDNLNAGFHAYNPMGGRFGKDGQEKLASAYSVGFGYDPSKKFFFSVEIEKQEGLPVNVKAGLQYEFISQVLARAGISTNNSVIYIGIGLPWRSFRLDATAAYHPQLGITPGLMIIFNFKPPNPRPNDSVGRA
jgi:hypothetical protein